MEWRVTDSRVYGMRPAFGGRGCHRYAGPMPEAHEQAPYLVGQLLLSMPGIGDVRFERAVIAICVHDGEGALGIMANRAHDGLGVRALMMQLDLDPGVTPDVPVLIGGPVEPGRGFVLHTNDYAGQSTIMVGGSDLALTSTLDVLKDIAAGTGPRQWLAALGYTGWAAGQLDTELTRHGWHSIDGDPALLFETPLEARWPRAFGTLGIDVGHLSANAGRA